jgi:hypothetical protein
VKQHKTISTGYLVGILVLLFASGFTVDQAVRNRFV